MPFTDAALAFVQALHASGALYALVPLYVLTTIAYRIWLHPLARYPGPLLGKFTSLPQMMAMAREDRVLWQKKMLDTYGDPVRISTDELLYGNLRSWQDIYGQSSNLCTKEPGFYNMFTATGASSLLNEVDRQKHARLRRLVSRGFSKGALVQDEAVIQHRIGVFISEVIAPAAEAGRSVDVYKKIMEHYLDIVSHLSFGKSFEAVSGNAEVTYEEVDGFMAVVPLQSFFPFLRYLPIPYIQECYRGLDKLIAFSQTHVRSFMDSVQRDPEFAKGTFLRNLVDAVDLETASKLQFEELVENSILFIIGGTDTAAVATLFFIWEVGRRPDVREKLVKEIREAFPDPKEMPTYEKASKLPYLEAVIQETLRLHGPLRSAFPRVSPGRAICGEFVPKGTVVSTSAHVTGRDPDVFPDPEAYRPERWLDASKEMRETSRPFSYGPRSCVGKNLAEIEVALTLARLYQLYDVVNDSVMTDAVMAAKDRGVTYPKGAKVVIKPTLAA